MGLEIEAKMKVDDIGQVRRRLVAAAAVFDGEHFETNTFFDTPTGALRSSDKGLRLRESCAVTTGDTRHIITFKGPRQAGELKTRQEIEFAVEDARAAAEMFEALGYKKIVSFQKKRTSYKLLGCKIELDELPYLGTYVEVEGPSADKVLHARETIGLADQPLVKTSYIGLLTTHLADRKIEKKDIEF